MNSGTRNGISCGRYVGINEFIVFGRRSGISSAISAGISPMTSSTSRIMSGMTLSRMAGAIAGNISGIIFSIMESPPGTCFIASIMGFIPAGMLSIICGKILTMKFAMFSGCMRMMNFSKNPHMYMEYSVVSGMSWPAATATMRERSSI